MKAKLEYYNKLYKADNHEDVYSTAKSLLCGPTVQGLPTYDSVQGLSWQFAGYFIQNIVTFHNGLRQSSNTDD